MSDFTEQPHPTMVLDEQQVVDFLIQQPDFFIRHASETEKMRVPHPVRGTVSLIEWQLARQRKQIRQLEDEITQLMEHAAANEILFSRLMALQKDLIGSSGLEDLLERLNHWAKSLGLLAARIRLFDDKWRLTAPSDFTHLALAVQKFELMRIQRFAGKSDYLGSLNGAETQMLLPNEHYIGSVALTLLGQYGDLGVLAFISRDSKHYQAGQGTLLLDQLSQLLPLLLARWIERIQ